MIRHITTKRGCELVASDGSLGKITGIVYDDSVESNRFAVVDLSHHNKRGKILLPVEVIGDLDIDCQAVHVDMTRSDLLNASRMPPPPGFPFDNRPFTWK